MRRNGLQPTVQAWNGLLLGYAARSDDGAVQDALKEMNASGVEENADTYEVLIRMCVRTDPNKAIEMLETMWHKDIPRHPDMYMAVMQTLEETPDLVSQEWLGKLLEMIPAEEQFRKAMADEDAEFGKPVPTRDDVRVRGD